ncbi:MAG: AAA15 family ATPase/GTPase [Saprospiraceae bacterium]|jgi:AAA15 family ATPase/GTPase
MILEFSVTNYKSFKDKTTFSMVADSSDKTQEQNCFEIGKTTLLKSAVIYGANASGKSNFMEAFGTMKNVITNSATYSSVNENSINTQYFPFEFDESSLSEPTVLELYFLIDGIKYHYSFSYNENEIIDEFLYYYPNTKQSLLFKRKNDDYEFGTKLKGEKNLVKNVTDKPQLFLSNGANNKMVQLMLVDDYFKNSFRPVPFLDKNRDTNITNSIAKFLYKKSNFIDYSSFMNLLTNLDTGITKIEIEKVKTLKANYKIFTYHQYKHKDGTLTEQKFQLERESIGTQKLFVIISLLLNTLKETDCAIMIDEFERSLHPQISKFLLSLFNNKDINKNGAQLIISTHDTELLSKENNLRRDQVWFVEKDEFGVSDLFSLTDVEGVRKDVPFDKWYLSNRFGGVPNLKTFNFKINFEHEPQTEIE